MTQWNRQVETAYAFVDEDGRWHGSHSNEIGKRGRTVRFRPTRGPFIGQELTLFVQRRDDFTELHAIYGIRVGSAIAKLLFGGVEMSAGV